MSTPSDSIKTSTIIYGTIGVAVVAVIGYASYFDYRRRNDAEFRRALKRESKKHDRAAKEEAEEERREYERQIRGWVDDFRESPIPSSAEEKEKLFMEEVSNGEKLCTEPSMHREAAFAFFKALTVYPQPSELMNIYDKTVNKNVLDILAEIIAYDRRAHPEGSNASSNGSGIE